MNQSPSNKPFFLLSFLPALAYWGLEAYFSLEIALIGGILLGIIEMLIEKKISGHVHQLSRVNLVMIVLLGGVALVAKEGVWFRLQPALSGIGIASYLAFKKIRRQSLMLEILSDMGQIPAQGASLLVRMEWHLMLFLFIFSAFMVKVAIYHSTSNWLFWKTIGFYLAFGAFMLLEMFWMRWMVRRKNS